MTFPQIKRSAISLGAVVSLYWLYSLIAVPLIEPEAVARSNSGGDPEIRDKKPSNRYHELLSHYFSPTDWELTQSPKVLESDQGMLLVQDYETLADGGVKLKPCTLIFFTKPEADSADTAAREAVVMRAPQGAVLEFDKPFNLKGAPRIGKLVGGQLVGEITIHSAPRRADGANDLHLVTRDVQFEDDQVWTKNAVDFRLGPNQGHGRELLMKLMPAEDDSDRKSPGRVESIQLARDVKMHLEASGKSLLPTGDRKANSAVASKEPPLEITSQGPFHFDLQSYVATFSQRVDVVRLNPQGQSDQMNCELLAVYFGEKDSRGQPSPPSRKLPRLDPRIIEARGNPVIVQAPSQQGHVRCQRLEYDLVAQRITLEGSEDILLHQGANEIRTRRLDYEPEPGKLGRLLASGPGWLQGHLPKDPGRKYQAQWSKELRLRPYEEEQILSLMGGARMQSTDFGGLDADEIHLWMKDAPKSGDVAAIGRVQPAAYTVNKPAGGLPAIETNVAPDRMMALGNVRLDSPQLTGVTDRLEMWIGQVTADSLSAGGSQTLAIDSNGPAASKNKSSRQFALGGKLVRVQALSDGKRTQVDDVWVDGQASLTETKLQRAGDQPLQIKGAQLHLAKASSDAAKVTVTGEPATIEGRGMSLVGGRIQLERAANRIWVEGPGRMSMPVTGDLTGTGEMKSQTPQTLVVTWQDGMDFDGRTVVFRRGVIAKTERQSLRTETLQVRLAKAIDFSNPQANPAGTRSEVEQVSCAGGALFETRTFDQQGQSAIDQMQLVDLTANRATGAISGRGPGWLTSVRKGSARSMFEAAGPPKPDDGRPKFSFLKVTFEKSLTGNLNKREITLADQTRCVYGPVNDWNGKLDADDPDSLGADGVLLTCDQLTVRTEPGASVKQPPLELEATGHTSVEGRQGTIRALAHQITYSQAKDLLVLKGGTDFARIYQQAEAGQPARSAVAREIRYWPKTNQVQGDAFQSIDWPNIGEIGNLGLPK
jgi:lipopolysaccharide export system protein LptA